MNENSLLIILKLVFPKSNKVRNVLLIFPQNGKSVSILCNCNCIKPEKLKGILKGLVKLFQRKQFRKTTVVDSTTVGGHGIKSY